MSVEVCEHGHLRRVCEVCELKAEMVRLREVCDRAGTWIRRHAILEHPASSMRIESAAVIDELRRAGKEATP